MVLPKEMRIKGYRSFEYIHKSAKRYRGNSMMLKVAKANENLIRIKPISSVNLSCRCAISISNKVSKKAVVRNRLRRLIHNHLKLKLFKKKKLSKYWAIISLNPNCVNKNSKDLLKECDNLLLDAGFC